MKEEERILKGILFSPANEDLLTIKLRAHKLSNLYTQLPEDNREERNKILNELVGSIGENSFILGPVFFHYGIHTKIGRHFFWEL